MNGLTRRLFSSTAVFLLAFAGHVSVAAAEPQLTVTVPTNGGVVTGTSVTVNFRASGINLVTTNVPLTEAGQRPDANRPGEGHVHFLLDLQPLVVWERPEPYAFTNVPPGDHELMVELVQNDHGALSPPVSQRIRFRTAVTLASSGAGAAPEVQSWKALLGAAALAAAGAGFFWRRRATTRTL